MGTAGYFIDMAVRDPAQPGRYLLAIECDGAAYYSSRSARDRDRLRQGVLEGLGWTFHRIWSTDWFRNRRQEINRVVEAIKAAKAAADREQKPVQTVPAAAEHRITRGEPVKAEDMKFSKPYVKVRLDAVSSQQLHQTSLDQLGGMIKRIVSAEAPVHRDEVTKRLMNAYSVVRAGSRITATVQEAIAHCSARRLFEVREDFLYEGAMLRVPVRDRSAFASADRKIEWVAPEEIDAALLESIQLRFSLSFEDAVAAAIEMLGFGRVTQRISGAVEERLNALIKSRRATVSGDMVRIPVAV